MQFKCPRENSYSNEKLEYEISTIEEKMGNAKAVVGARLPEFDKTTHANINQYYRRGNCKVIFLT